MYSRRVGEDASSVVMRGIPLLIIPKYRMYILSCACHKLRSTNHLFIDLAENI